MKPLMLGYQRVRIDAEPDARTAGERVLAGFAEREGYTLGAVFVESPGAGPESGLVALVAAIQRGGITAVAVPCAEDLGRLPRVRQVMRNLLEREGIRVLIAQPVVDGFAGFGVVVAHGRR